jgi:hypothetical protein
MPTQQDMLSTITHCAPHLQQLSIEQLVGDVVGVVLVPAQVFLVLRVASDSFQTWDSCQRGPSSVYVRHKSCCVIMHALDLELLSHQGHRLMARYHS